MFYKSEYKNYKDPDNEANLASFPVTTVDLSSLREGEPSPFHESVKDGDIVSTAIIPDNYVEITAGEMAKLMNKYLPNPSGDKYLAAHFKEPVESPDNLPLED